MEPDRDLLTRLGGRELPMLTEPAADGSRALRRHPDWIRARMPSGDNFHDLKRLMRDQGLRDTFGAA